MGSISQIHRNQMPDSRIMSWSDASKRPRKFTPFAAYRRTKPHRPSRFFPSSFHHHRAFNNIPLDATATSFEPTSTPTYEHPPPQYIEPFWHQYPPWVRTSLGTITNMDTAPVIIGFGPNSRYGQPAPIDGPARHHFKPELVDVYNVDEFIQAIPLKTLVRFSAVAKKTFPRPLKQARVKSLTALKSSTSNPSSTEPASPRDSGYHGSPTQAADPTTDFSTGAGLTLPPPIIRSGPKGRKQLKLFLDAIEMPSNGAIQVALKWMNDNAAVHDSAPLLEYGPTSLKDCQLIDLIDYYQAALCFDLCPFPKRLKVEILQRLTNHRPNVNAFRQLARFLPLDDSAVKRVVNSFHDFWRAKEYTSEELHEFDVFLAQEENMEFDARLVRTFKARRVGYARDLEASQGLERAPKHGSQKRVTQNAVRKTSVHLVEGEKDRKQGMKAKSKPTLQSEGNDAGEEVLEDEASVKDEQLGEVEEQTADGEDSSTGGRRRRPRRAQQARGKALAAAAGA